MGCPRSALCRVRPRLWGGCASAIAARYIRFCCSLAWYWLHASSLPTFWFSRMARMSVWFSSRYF